MELVWEEVWENHAFSSKSWRECPLSGSDPSQFTHSDYRTYRHPKDIPIELFASAAAETSERWLWCGDWCYTKWKYSRNWAAFDSDTLWKAATFKRARCRRRIWKRPRIRACNDSESVLQSITEVIYENQRHILINKRWASPYLPKDRPHWSDASGHFKTQGRVNGALPLSWEWKDDQPWTVQMDCANGKQSTTDAEGWQYATDFKNTIHFHAKYTPILHHVRRRKWLRTRIRSKQTQVNRSSAIVQRKRTLILAAADDGNDNDNGSGSKSSASWTNGGTLVVSYTNQFTLAWSTFGVIDSSGYQCSVWKPKLSDNEFELGHLLIPEKNYPSSRFLIIIKKVGSDADAYARPIGLSVIWSTKFFDPSTQKYGFFYKPVAPKGYVSLGDVAIVKKKGDAVTVADFPQFMCVKISFVDKFEEPAAGFWQPNIRTLIKPRDLIWTSQRLSGCVVHCQLWTQPPFSNEVASPMYCCSRLEKPDNVYPSLSIRNVQQEDPDNITVNCGWLQKRGKGMGQPKKRFFILTSEKKMYYFESDECRVQKGIIDLESMDRCCTAADSLTSKSSSRAEWFYIHTPGRKWELQCGSAQEAHTWVAIIQRLHRNASLLTEQIINVQIQGLSVDSMEDMRMDSTHNKNNNSSRASVFADNTNNKQVSTYIFDEPFDDQILRLFLMNMKNIKRILKNEHQLVRESTVDRVLLSASVSVAEDEKEPSHVHHSHTNHHALSIYKYFDDAWNCIWILRKHFSDIQSAPAAIRKIVAQLPDLEEQSKQYIMNDIKEYGHSIAEIDNHNKQQNPFEIIKMCDACAVMESFSSGQQSCSNLITEQLLKDVRLKFAAGQALASCACIGQRVDEWRKQIKCYDNVYSFFIPARWKVPHLFSLQFCQLTIDQMNAHLTNDAETVENILAAKTECALFEAELTAYSLKLLQRLAQQSDTGIGKQEMENDLPKYEGMLTSVLDIHLRKTIEEEKKKAEQCSVLARNETFSFLSNSGSLKEIFDSEEAVNESQRKLESCQQLLLTLRNGFHKCLQISRSQPLLDLLLCYRKALMTYFEIVQELTHEAMATNGVINIKPLRDNDNKKNGSRASKTHQLTDRYLWFEEFYCRKRHRQSSGTQSPISVEQSMSTIIPDEEDDAVSDGAPKQGQHSNSNSNNGPARDLEISTVQQLLTYYVLIYNTLVFCKESMLNLVKAAYQAIEGKKLKSQINFRSQYNEYEKCQFFVSEMISQIIVYYIAYDMQNSYKSMHFLQPCSSSALVLSVSFAANNHSHNSNASANTSANSQTDSRFVQLENMRFVIENQWTNLTVQLLYIMNTVDYKLMIKRCLFLFCEYFYESVLNYLKNLNAEIAHVLHGNYKYVQEAIVRQLSNISQQLSVEISNASEICFAPLDTLFALLFIEHRAILIETNEERQQRLEKEEQQSMLKNNIEFDLFESLQSTFKGLRTNSDTGNGNGNGNGHNGRVATETDLKFVCKYTEFEIKCVDFYHNSNVRLDFQALLLKLIQHQLEATRNIGGKTNNSTKSTFFTAFDIRLYRKPTVNDKKAMKEHFLSKIMQCRSLDRDTQQKIKQMYLQKSPTIIMEEQKQSLFDGRRLKQQMKDKHKLNRRLSGLATNLLLGNSNNNNGRPLSRPQTPTIQFSQSLNTPESDNDNTNPFDSSQTSLNREILEHSIITSTNSKNSMSNSLSNNWASNSNSLNTNNIALAMNSSIERPKIPQYRAPTKPNLPSSKPPKKPRAPAAKPPPIPGRSGQNRNVNNTNQYSDRSLTVNDNSSVKSTFRKAAKFFG